MNTFYLVENSEKKDVDKAAALIHSICDEKGKKAYRGPGYMKRESLPKDVDCVITLGGDGTLIRAAREAADRNIPVIGVNMGHLGYLSSVSALEDIPEMMERLFLNKYTVEKRMMVKAVILREGRETAVLHGLNEAVITRTKTLKPVKCKVGINEEFLNEYTSDGIIISTPTGSTAYNLSAGGPIIDPSAQMLIITPICPHALTQRSVVLSSEKKVEVDILGGEQHDRELVVDGYESRSLDLGDRVELTESELYVSLLKLPGGSFLENIRNKMNRI